MTSLPSYQNENMTSSLRKNRVDNITKHRKLPTSSTSVTNILESCLQSYTSRRQLRHQSREHRKRYHVSKRVSDVSCHDRLESSTDACNTRLKSLRSRDVISARLTHAHVDEVPVARQTRSFKRHLRNQVSKKDLSGCDDACCREKWKLSLKPPSVCVFTKLSSDKTK